MYLGINDEYYLKKIRFGILMEMVCRYFDRVKEDNILLKGL